MALKSINNINIYYNGLHMACGGFEAYTIRPKPKPAKD